MRRTAKTRTARNKRLTERYADCHGITFDSYRYHLPSKVSDWQAVVRVDDPQVCQDMHAWSSCCWNCRAADGYERRLEAHHLCAGRHGRSDEYCAIVMLCRECHGNVNTPVLPFGRLLALKHKFDRPHTDWIRTALLARRFLPPLILDNGETYE